MAHTYSQVCVCHTSEMSVSMDLAFHNVHRCSQSVGFHAHAISGCNVSCLGYVPLQDLHVHLQFPIKCCLKSPLLVTCFDRKVSTTGITGSLFERLYSAHLDRESAQQAYLIGACEPDQVWDSGAAEVWRKDMNSGAVVLLLLNTGNTMRNITTVRRIPVTHFNSVTVCGLDWHADSELFHSPVSLWPTAFPKRKSVLH